MTRIESDGLIIARNAQDVYAFLSDLRNYKSLMPDRVSAFTADADLAELKIDGMGRITMRKGACTPNSIIELIPEGSIPFTFTMRWEMNESDGETGLMGIVDADLNMMLKMIAHGPLREFVNTQAHRLKAVLESKAAV